MSPGLCISFKKIVVKINKQTLKKTKKNNNDWYEPLRALFCLQVAVQGNANSDDVVTISLNQPANRVEKKVPELEK